MNNNSLHFVKKPSSIGGGGASRQSHPSRGGSLNQSLGGGSHGAKSGSISTSFQNIPRPPPRDSQLAVLRDDTYMQYVNQRRNGENRHSNSNSSANNNSRVTINP